MVEVINAEKQVKITREFEGLRASESKQNLRIVYIEKTFVDDVEVKSEQKEYSRDYAFWKASELGQAILSMVDLDLAQEDPSTPRNENN